MKLKLISFNIRCCDDENGNSVAERAPRLAAVTAPYDADLIGLQEYTPLWEEHIEKYYGGKYEIFNKYRGSTFDIESAPILWKKDKFDCIGKGYFWLSDTPEVESRGWDKVCACFRICEYVTLKEKVSGEIFTFMNTHFGFGDDCQIASARLIHEYSEKISSYPTFVTGDFNMIPSAPAYREMTKHFTDVNAVTAMDMRDTYHGYHPEEAHNEHIDYCFVSEKVKPLHQQILDETVDGKFPSDHYGIYVELDI